MNRTIEDLYSLSSRAVDWMITTAEFRSDPTLAEVLANHPRLVVAVSHSSPLSWLPAAALLASETMRAGGEARRPLGIFHRFLHFVPLVQDLVGLIGQSDGGWGVAQITSALRSGDYTDVVILPEGHNSFFGKDEQVRPFVSSRFIELAVASQAPILVVAHLGSESWGRHVGGSWLLPLLRRMSPALHRVAEETGGFCLPFIPHRIPLFKMACRLHRPELTQELLSSDPVARAQQLDQEADQVKQIMRQLIEGLHGPDEVRPPSPEPSAAGPRPNQCHGETP